MKIIQLKSTCCGATVRRFGERRRQCQTCQRTWRIRLARRGRDRRRILNDDRLLRRYLDHSIGSLRRRSLNHGGYPAVSGLERRLRQARDRFLAQSWPAVPAGDLILIADAFSYQHHYRYRTMYLLLLRSTSATSAVILSPVCVEGKESQIGWNLALESIEPAVFRRIKALVCDGHRGLVYAAWRQGWVLQRCHFHLKKALNNYVRTGPLSHHEPLASKVHALVDDLLSSPDDRRVAEGILPQLELCCQLAPSVGARRVLSGLVRYMTDFRSYIYYDSLHLPKTSNVAESAVSLVRDLEKQAHGWSSPESFEAWAAAALKHAGSLNCQESQPN